MDLLRISAAIYQHCYRSLIDERFVVDLSRKSHKKTLENFLIRLDKRHGHLSIGLDYLIDYISYQFYYWSDKDTLRKVQLEWVFGKEAFKRYLSEGRKDVVQFYKHDLEVDFSLIYHRYETYHHTPDYSEQSDYEKNEKLRFYNTIDGFDNCIRNTTLYRNDKICLFCNFKSDCKKLLQKYYPQLHKQRLTKDGRQQTNSRFSRRTIQSLPKITNNT